MAIGFQSGMFGRRDPYRRPWDTPGIGDDFNQRMDMPGSEMPIGVQQINQPPKRGIFGRGGKAWDVLGAFGDAFSENEPVYAMSKQAEQNRLFEAQKAQAQRMQAREDKMWEWQNKPKDAPNNDTINDFNWYKNLPEEDRKLYHKMKPVVGYMADGTPRIINPYEAQQQDLDGQPASEDGFDYTPGPGGRANPQNWKKSGGQAATPPVTFRR